jgi:hypothetical protein
LRLGVFCLFKAVMKQFRCVVFSVCHADGVLSRQRDASIRGGR